MVMSNLKTMTVICGTILVLFIVSACHLNDDIPSPPFETDDEIESVLPSTDEALPPDSDEGVNEPMVLALNWGNDPPNLDPQTANDQVSMWILNSVFEGLMRMNPDGTIGMGLAESYEVSEDECTYTFTLREAYWSNGDIITAHDFKRSWLRAIDPETASNYAYQLFYIEGARGYYQGNLDDISAVGIQVIDASTLRITLESPIAYFLALTTFPTYFPTHESFDDHDGIAFNQFNSGLIFSGPYKIGSWEKEKNLTLVKNEHYHDADSVKLDKIVGYILKENNKILQKYEQNELDFIVLPVEYIEKYRHSSEYQTLAEATTWYLMFNTESKFFSNHKMRLAFSLGTDADAYVNVIAQNSGVVAEGFSPPSMAGKDHSFSEDRYAVLPSYDPVRAREIFQEALEEMDITLDEFENEVTILSEYGDTWNRRAQFFQSQWKENLGVNLFIEQLSFSERLQRYEEKDYEIAYVGWGGEFNDPISFMGMLVSEGGNNFTNWSHPDYDNYIKQATLTIGDERIDALTHAEAIIADELPIYPIYHPNKNLAIKSYVKGLAIFPVGSDYDFKWTYIERQ